MSTPLIPAAVIYCPALNETEPAKVISDVAKRLARTLDHHSIPVGTAYKVRTAAPEDYGTDGRTDVCEIVRVDAGKNPETEGVVTHRVYCLDYLSLLDDRTAEANVLLKTWKLLCLFFMMTWRFLVACALANSFSKMQKISMAVGGFMLSLVLVYAVLTVGTVVRLAADAWEGRSSLQTTTDECETAAKEGSALEPAFKPGTGWLARAWGRVVANVKDIGEWLAGKVAALWALKLVDLWDFLASPPARIIAVTGALGLSVTGLRVWLDRNVMQSLRFCRYLEMGSARAACSGRFNALLERVLSGAPSRTDVVAYSLGSLVALDALYPTEGNPDVRVAQVRSLTTIGCPFDFVRTFWNKYFDHREIVSRSLVWRNVYSPVDLLGSNFANADGIQPQPNRGINASARASETPAEPERRTKTWPSENLFYDPMGRRELKLVDALLMGGFTAHTQYWVAEDFDAESCFQCFVPKLYEAS